MKSLTRLVVATLLGAAIGDAAVAAETYGRNKWMLCRPSGEDVIVSGVTSATAFTPDGARVAIAAEERTVHICDTATGAEIVTLAVPSATEDDDYVNLVALSPDGTRLITASNDKMVRLWDIAAGRELAAMEHPAPVYFAAFSPDGGHIVTSVSDRKVRLFNTASGNEAAVIEHPGVTYVNAFSPDGAHLVTGSSDGTVHMWDMGGNREISFIAGSEKQVYDAAFSPDGTRIATASDDGSARIFDAASGLLLLTLDHPAPVRSAAFSADGAKIVTGSGNDAHVFDAASGEELAVLKGHDEWVNDAQFSSDGSRIVTGSSDDSLRVWDAASGETVAVLTGHLGSVASASFSPDGERIVSLGGPEGILWTKLEATSLPDDAIGLWYADFGTPEMPLPPEFVREMCISSPIRIDKEGLVVFLEMTSGGEPPEAVLHLRCAADLTCQIFAGAPGQGVEGQGDGSLAFSGDAADLCLAGECRPIARCPEIAWTDEERDSGFAGRWEAAVLGAQP